MRGPKQRLELQLKQGLALVPEMRMRLSMLRMNSAELAEELAREAAVNPFLILEPRKAPSTDFRLAEELSAPRDSFQESLRQQLRHLSLPPEMDALAGLLVAELGPEGFLETPLEDLAAEYGIPLEKLDEALAIVQRCDPLGIGSRDLSEFLTLQLIDRGLNRAAAQQTVANLALFARRDWAGVAARLGLDQHEARERAALLRGLATQPVQPVEGDPEQRLHPDLTVERKADGRLSIAVDRALSGQPRIDESLARRAAQGDFGVELLARARAMLAALDQRGRTLERIGTWILEHQAGFMAAGIAGLSPATRLDVAGALQLHPSTISRAIAGKAIDIDGRLWPISFFFSASVAGKSGPISSRVIQRRIGELIAAESPKAPLSDNNIAQMLRSEGVDIARRTVAKYREGLRIPSSSARRRLASARRGG